MREIKFRGKRKDIDWKYGYLTIIEKPCYESNLIAIKPFDEKWITYGVDPDSVGEYTGLKDKNGKEIYEGDMVIETEREPGFPPYDGTKPRVVESRNGCWCFDARRYDDGDWIRFGFWTYSNEGKNQLHQLEVIGNIYEKSRVVRGVTVK